MRTRRTRAESAPPALTALFTLPAAASCQ